MSLLQVYVTSDWALEKVLLYALAEGTKIHLVLDRKMQESLIFDCYTSEHVL